MDNDDRDAGEPGWQPPASRRKSRGLSYDAEIERAEAAFAAVRKVVGGRPVLDTVGDLAALLALLPPELTLFVDEVVRIDRDAESDGEDPRFVVVAESATTSHTPRLPVRDNDGNSYDVLEPALQLGIRVLPSPDAPAPVKTRPYYLPDRLADVLDRGEIAEYLVLLGRHLTDIARNLTHDAPGWWSGGTTPELAASADELRGIASRLTAHAPTVEALINEDYQGEDTPE
jgi:hypothetical protein